MLNTKTTTGLITAALLATTATAALAQGASGPAGLDEIIVTAQKRAQSIQEVPITMAAFGSDFLDRKNIRSVTDLASVTPAINIAQSSASRTRLRIRGVGSRKFDIGAESSVGVFIDEVYLPRFSNIAMSLLDLERIEILKGPQGTLFGRNTAGGALSIVTKDPTEDLEGYVEAGYAEKDSFLVKGGVSGAIVPEKVLVRLSAGYEEKGGYNTNTTTGQTDDRQSTAARLQLMLTPSETLTAKASIEYSKLEQDMVFSDSLSFPLLLQSPLVAVDPRSADPRSEALNTDGFVDQEGLRATLRLDWAGEDVAFTSLTGYQESELDQLEDFEYTSVDVAKTGIDEESDTFSQEFRLSSVDGGAATFGGNLQWLLGAYYYHDDAQRTDSFTWGANSLPVFLVGGPSSITDAVSVDVKTESIAAFGQLNYDITDRLSLILGARYTEDEKTYTLSGVTDVPGVPALVAGYTFSGKRKWTSFDPKATLTMQWTDDVMTYASYSQGFKSGGVQFAALVASVAQQVFDPEQLDAYEIGVKSDLFDGALRLNAAAYLYDYTNLQQQRVTVLNGSPAAVTANAASSDIKGIDLEAQWLVSDALNLRFAYSYLDAEFDSFVFDPINGIDFSGNTMPSSPKHTLSFGGDYTVDLPNQWQMTIGTDWVWTDEFNFDADTTDVLTRQDDYLLGQAQVEFTAPEGRYSIKGYVTNITDKLYATSVTRQSTTVFRTVSEGRRFGVQLKASF